MRLKGKPIVGPPDPVCAGTVDAVRARRPGSVSPWPRQRGHATPAGPRRVLTKQGQAGRATQMVGLIAPWPRQPFGARAGRALALAAGLVLALGHGCAKAPEPTPPRTPRDIEVPEYLKDTVGEVARFAGREALVVQGFGFVTGLDGTGTTVMPPGIRRQILEVMHRNKVPDAEQILASRDTAVVSVFGQAPPGARAGERFDLGVRVVPGTETTSLEGGFVLACELRRVQMSRGVEARSGKQNGKANVCNPVPAAPPRYRSPPVKKKLY